MEFKKIQHIKINKSKYDYLVLHLKGGNMGESIDKLAKKYPFKLKNDKLYITTKDPPPKMFSNQTGNLLVRSYNETYEFEVVYKENVMGVINEIYFDTLTGGFRGREGLYSVIQHRYVGITKTDVNNFLKGREIHQMMKNIPLKVMTPLRPRYCNNWWQLDILFLKKIGGYNNQYKYILTITDIFSKYCWLRPLKKRLLNHVVYELEKIILQNGAPHILHGDNEFNKDAIKKLAKYGIKQFRYGRSHNSKSQGAVERLNKQIRHYINHDQKLYNTKKWLDMLPFVEANINYVRHNTTKQIPFEVYRGTTPPIIELLAEPEYTIFVNDVDLYEV